MKIGLKVIGIGVSVVFVLAVFAGIVMAQTGGANGTKNMHEESSGSMAGMMGMMSMMANGTGMSGMAEHMDDCIKMHKMMHGNSGMGDMMKGMSGKM